MSFFSPAGHLSLNTVAFNYQVHLSAVLLQGLRDRSILSTQKSSSSPSVWRPAFPASSIAVAAFPALCLSSWVVPHSPAAMKLNALPPSSRRLGSYRFSNRCSYFYERSPCFRLDTQNSRSPIQRHLLLTCISLKLLFDRQLHSQPCHHSWRCCVIIVIYSLPSRLLDFPLTRLLFTGEGKG